MSRLTLAATAFLLLALSCFGQTTARVVGTVRDGSGALMPSVTIRITNLQTNAVRTAVTDGSGDYVATNLAIGTYEVAAESAGFKRAVQRPVVLDVDQTGRVDFALQPGDVTESVTVQASAPLIESERSSLGQVIENKTIVQLPLNGRNFIRLGSLVAGTTTGAPNNTVARSREGGEALTANGQRAEYNNYMLDGMDNNESLFGVAVIVPSIDAIQEFKVQTSNYSAEYGRGSGAIVNVAIKAGANDFHGSAYDFLRNDKLDARNTFSAIKNPLRQNQFGGAVGGPVWIPKLYNGHNRTFFFFNYEGLRVRSTSTNRYIVPTVAQRSGNFTGLPVIYDPLSLDANGNRTPFPGNQIPAARLNASSVKTLSFYPLPNSTDPAGNYIRAFSSPTDNDQINVRGDQSISAADQLFIRYSKTNSTQTSPTINFAGGNTIIKTQGGAIGYTRILSARSVNEFRVGAQRYVYNLLPEGLGVNGAEALGLPTLTADSTFLHYPTITIQNFTGFGNGTLLYRVENSYQAVEALSIALGKHALKMGGDFRVYQANNSQPQFTSGDYTFSGAFTGVRGSQYQNGVADFLLGLPSQQQILNLTGYDAARLRNKRVNAYIQDDYQVTSRLTLNLGVRWERDGAWNEANNRFAYFDFATGQIVYPKSAKIPFTSFPYPYRFDDINTLKVPTDKAFAPRIGFALRPFGGNRTVVRGAYGIFWGQPIVNVLLNSAFTPPPYQIRQTLISSTATPQLQFGIFPGIDASTLIPSTPTLYTINPNTYTNGYVQQWNFGIEREIFRGMAVKAAYVGNKGTHLEERYEGNPALPPGPGTVASRRLYPKFQSITSQQSRGFSTYNSLQLSAEKRYDHGLLFLASYTYSKSLDDSSSWIGVDTGGSAVAQDPSRLFLEKGRSAFDLRHRFTLSAAYDLPFHSQHRVLNAAIHGWQTSGILTLQTGFPFGVTVGGDIPNAGTGFTRANLVGDPSAGGDQSINRWFNPAAFAQPPAYTFGTSGRNVLTGPGTKSLDLTVLRMFHITEKTSLQFRAEFFNFPNHPNYGLPNSTIGSSAIGTIRSASNRISQLALKYVF